MFIEVTDGVTEVMINVNHIVRVKLLEYDNSLEITDIQGKTYRKDNFSLDDFIKLIKENNV